MPTQKTRRIVLIDTRYQLRMAGAFLLLQLVLTGLFSFGLYLFMDSELKAGLASAHAAYRSLEQMLLPIVAVLAGFSLLLSALLIISFVVILSHRIAGPIYRFRAQLEELGRRRIPPHAGIRPGDQLGEVSETLGRALEILAADFEALRAAADAMEKARQSQDPEALARSGSDLQRILSEWKPADRA